MRRHRAETVATVTLRPAHRTARDAGRTSRATGGTVGRDDGGGVGDPAFYEGARPVDPNERDAFGQSQAPGEQFYPGPRPVNPNRKDPWALAQGQYSGPGPDTTGTPLDTSGYGGPPALAPQGPAAPQTPEIPPGFFSAPGQSPVGILPNPAGAQPGQPGPLGPIPQPQPGGPTPLGVPAPGGASGAQGVSDDPTGAGARPSFSLPDGTAVNDGDPNYDILWSDMQPGGLFNGNGQGVAPGGPRPIPAPAPQTGPDPFAGAPPGSQLPSPFRRGGRFNRG